MPNPDIIFKNDGPEGSTRKIKRRRRDVFSNLFKRVTPRRSMLIVPASAWDSTEDYTKDSLNKMVKQLPDIRGAMVATINAVVGNIKFITAEKTDKDSDNQKVQDITNWFNDPEHDSRKFQEQFMWSRLMRSNVFMDLQHKTLTTQPWMYVCNAAFCKHKYNKKGTRIEGFDYSPPHAKKDSMGKAPVQPFRGKNYLITSADLLDGSEIGTPALVTLIEDANIYNSARTYIKALYKSYGLGMFAFIAEELSPDEYATMKEDLKQRKGTSLALHGKIKIHNLSTTPKEMLLGELDKVWAEKVMTVFSTPPVVMCKFGATGIKDDKTSLNSFGTKVRADKRILEGAINQIIIKLYGPEYSIVRAQSEEYIDPTAKAERWKLLMDIGAITPNMVREELGLELITDPWGDEPYNFNFPPQRERLEAGKSEGSEIEKFIKTIMLLAEDYDKREEMKKRFESLDYALG